MAQMDIDVLVKTLTTSTIHNLKCTQRKDRKLSKQHQRGVVKGCMRPSQAESLVYRQPNIHDPQQI
jgi:hypothetical protein